MKKNLVYYCLGLNPLYVEIFKKSLESLDKSNPELIDVLVITNRDFCEKYLTNIDRKNLFFHYVDEYKNGDDICFSKLNVFDWNKINEYENIFMSDSDVLFNIDMNTIFDKCTNENRLYAPVEDYSYENHRRIYFSLGDYTDDDIEFFKKNEIHTFNCGTYMLKNSLEMKKHFSNISRIIKGHKGDYFSDQSFMNYYFNRMKLVDYSVIDCSENLIYVVEENVNFLNDFNKKILHFLGNTYYGEDKIHKMKKILNKIHPEKKVHITNVTEERKKVHFVVNEEMDLTIEVKIENAIIYKETIHVIPNVSHWIGLNDGYHNKTIDFYNEEFSQSYELHGTIMDLLSKVKKIHLSDTDTELSSYFRNINSIFYSKRKLYFDYYSKLYEHVRYYYFNILELNSSTNSYRNLKNYFLNSKMTGTIYSLKEFENCAECELFYFENRTKKLLDPLIKLNNEESFDLIISTNGDLLVDKEILGNLIKLMRVGGRLFFEGVRVDDFPDMEQYLGEQQFNLGVNFVEITNHRNNKSNLLEILRIS